MQSLDEKPGKEKEQGINYQSYRMNFALIGNKKMKNIIPRLIHGHFIILYPSQCRPHAASKAQILTDLQYIVTTRIK